MSYGYEYDGDYDPPPSTEAQVDYILKLMAKLGWPDEPINVSGFDFDGLEDAESSLSALNIAEASDLIEELLGAVAEMKPFWAW